MLFIPFRANDRKLAAPDVNIKNITEGSSWVSRSRAGGFACCLTLPGAAGAVIDLLRNQDDKESKMTPIIEREKSMRKALELYDRY